VTSGKRPRGPAGAGKPAEGLKISGELDRQTAEVLRLELQRLAQRYGFEITDFRVEPIEDAPESA
jgi:hypothetical protein